MKKKLELQYYYKQDECPAKLPNDADCICWHDEGKGPCANEKHNGDAQLVEWRIKPHNTVK